MLRTLLNACLISISAIAIAEDDPRPIPPHQPYQCDLPTLDEQIDIKYKIWYVDSESNPDGKEEFCSEVVNTQDDFYENEFYVKFYTEPDNPRASDNDETDVCSQLITSDVDNSAHVKKIHAFVKTLNSTALTRADIASFIIEANDTYYEKYHINIYVVATNLIETRGMHLRDQIRVDQGLHHNQTQGNLIFVPYEVSLGTLTHEMAHAFSLDHVNYWSKPYQGGADVLDQDKMQKEYCVKYDYWDNVCHFETTNFLWAGATQERMLFTDGQKQRMACNQWSALNVQAPTNQTTANEESEHSTFSCPDWTLADLSTIEEFGGVGPMKSCPPLH